MGRKILSILIVILFIFVAKPLVLPLAMGGVFAVLFFPWLEKLERRGLRTGLSSALLTITVTLCFLLPAALLAFLAVKAGLQQLHAWKDSPRSGTLIEAVIQSPGLHSALERLSNWFPVTAEELAVAATDLARTVGGRLTELLARLFTQLPSMAMGLAVMVLSIYFFLVDGRRVVAFLRQNSFFNRKQTERFIHAFATMCRSVILATVVSGFVQAVVFSIFCVSLGVRNTALIGFLVFLASFIPLVGSVPVTITVVVQQFLIGYPTEGFILLVGAGLVGILDNFIRPLVLRGAGNLHPLLAFVGAFGGLQVLGVTGVFLGPIIAGLFVVTIRNMLQGDTE